ncbi:hypothetical protein D3C79_799180 [compost metagenome]
MIGRQRLLERVYRYHADKFLAAFKHVAIVTVFITQDLQRRTRTKTGGLTDQGHRATFGDIFGTEYVADIDAAEEGTHIIVGRII